MPRTYHSRVLNLRRVAARIIVSCVSTKGQFLLLADSCTSHHLAFGSAADRALGEQGSWLATTHSSYVRASSNIQSARRSPLVLDRDIASDWTFLRDRVRLINLRIRLLLTLELLVVQGVSDQDMFTLFVSIIVDLIIEEDFLSLHDSKERWHNFFWGRIGNGTL